MRALLLPLIVVSVPSLLLAAPARGQGADLTAAPTVPPMITEAEFLARLASDPRRAQLAARTTLARAEIGAAAVRPNPGLALDREQAFGAGGGTSNYLRATVPLELSGRRGARVEAARAEARAVSADEDASGFVLQMQALRVFRLAAYARARVDLLRTERAALAGAVEIVARRSAAGAAAGYDLQRVQLELASYDDHLAEAEGELAATRLELGTLVGADTGVAAVAAVVVPAPPPPLEQLLTSALTDRAETRAVAARRDSARALARAADRAWVPDLSLAAGIMTQQAADADLALGYVAGLALSLPVFDRGRAEAARARALRQAAEADQATLARRVPLELRARHLALRQLLARVDTIGRDQVARLDQLRRSAEAAYRDGAGGDDLVALLDAFAISRDTRLRELALRRDAGLAELDLWTTLGRRP